MTTALRDLVARIRQAVEVLGSGAAPSTTSPIPHPREVQFSVRLERDTLDGGWAAECIDLPGCVSQGETEHEALENIIDAITAVLSARMESQLPVDGPDCNDGGSTRSFALSV